MYINCAAQNVQVLSTSTYVYLCCTEWFGGNDPRSDGVALSPCPFCAEWEAGDGRSDASRSQELSEDDAAALAASNNLAFLLWKRDLHYCTSGGYEARRTRLLLLS